MRLGTSWWLIATLSFAFSATTAHGQARGDSTSPPRWARVYSRASDTTYVDRFTVEHRRDGSLTIWVKVVANSPKAIPLSREKWKTTLANYLVDCRDRTMRSLRLATYSAAGDLISSDSIPGATATRPLPDTFGEGVLHLACDAKNKVNNDQP